MHLARCHFSHLLAQRFRRVAALIASAITRHVFSDVLEHAADALDNLGARADGVFECDAKFPQALADFREAEWFRFALQQGYAFPNAALKIQNFRHAEFAKDVRAKTANRKRRIGFARFQGPAQNAQRAEIYKQNHLSAREIKPALAVWHIKISVKREIVTGDALQRRNAVIAARHKTFDGIDRKSTRLNSSHRCI